MSKMDQTHIACKGSWVGGGKRKMKTRINTSKADQRF